ncbi:hypothetical protein ASPVEDRAFT_862034 [Aspergillus versicolor CBS 583.65]|uniref:Uncharacterized protein n=1 Tax=Aspergillus versicolor CBS 583.65 TaxID=1036611 RepID=A0A1L9PVP6_ASPVE|nr:uncharacterized protein ASPVEDRAFT_862034 [Aspergillus versicolor CBS 583.65]OJJ05624.1 hypothetical protein ASPVEDRAFT_862034 [Aspergillus versicolor CBS 583.65]
MTSGTSPRAAAAATGGPDSVSLSRQPATNTGQSSSPPSTTTQPHSSPQPAYPGLGPNFAHDPKAPFTVSYDQDVYLQLMAGEEDAVKTPTQIYREKWVRRALNPAISDPRGEPSSIDFECAETQKAKDRF